MASHDRDGMVVQLTVGELRALVREEIQGALSARKDVGRWVDVAKAAEIFGCTPQTVRNWIRNGAPAKQVGTSTHPSYRIDLAEFNQWAERSQKAVEHERDADSGCHAGRVAPART